MNRRSTLATLSFTGGLVAVAIAGFLLASRPAPVQAEPPARHTAPSDGPGGPSPFSQAAVGDLLAGNGTGLTQCTQLLEVGGFEGSPQTVSAYWTTSPDAFRSGLPHEGAFSMLLADSVGSYPTCASLDPWLFQTVTIPLGVSTLTHITVDGYRLVGGSEAPCSVFDTTDADDVLWVQLRDRQGTPITGPVRITDGGAITETWEHFSVDFTDDVDLESLAGQEVQMYFYGTHDADYYGTWFYLDNLECNVCTQLPITLYLPMVARDFERPFPAILASDYEVYALDWITVDMYDHDPAGEPYTLLWCRTSLTGGIASSVLVTDVDVDDATWDALDLAVEIPEGSDGFYRLETHEGAGSCGDGGSLVAYSPGIYAREGPPPGKPPGLKECEQLLQVGGFEGNPQSVSAYWTTSLDAQRSGLPYEGTFSMELLDSLGAYPACSPLDPWVYQTAQIPAEVYTLTTITVDGYRLVGGSEAPCSVLGSTDADDVLWVGLRDDAGQPISDSVSIANGGAVSETWASFSVDLTDKIDLAANAGQEVQIYFYGTHDADEYGTWFYLDELECNVCTEWPIPEEITGTASIGGLVRALVGAVPTPMPGMDVWAYSQGGQVYRTQSIHDGTYHFYNIPPGNYVVYSEGWVGGNFVVDTRSVSVVPDERNYSVHLLLE